MSNLIEKLNWRYATKKYDPSKIVPTEKVERVLEAIRLSASSSGLQPYQVLLITNRDLRAQLLPAAWNQAQVVDASHLLVFAAWDTYTRERINKAFDLVNEQRGFKNEGWEGYRKLLLEQYPARDPETNFQHAAKQAYLAVGTALAAAADEGVDATPMEGFDPVKVDEILKLGEKGLRSVVLLPLGYRAADGDWLAPLKKVRRSREEFVIEYA